MSPEQLEGRDTDARSDIFAFGAVLYEMLTGKKAFEGSSRASLITAIMSTEPPAVSERQSMSPPGLDRVVKKCLAKDPDDRWQTARDLADELKWVSSDAPEPRTRAARRSVLPWVVAGADLVVGLGLWAMSPPPTPPATAVRLAVTIPPTQQLELNETATTSLALSPDGQHLAYVAIEDGTSRIFLRRLDSFEAEPLPGTEGASRPFFSPDGAWLGFHRDRQLQKISLSGGVPITICDAPFVRYRPTWGADDTIVFNRGARSGFARVHADGGSPETLTSPDPERGEQDHRWPQFLPDVPATPPGCREPRRGPGRRTSRCHHNASRYLPGGLHNGVRQLFRRSMHELEASPIRGTERAMLPFFSPNGDWIGFYAEGELKKVPISGGEALTLCEVIQGGRGASWGADDAIVFTTNQSGTLMRVSASGGVPEPITSLEKSETEHRSPEFLPGGKGVLFTERSGPYSIASGTLTSARILVVSLETGIQQFLVDGYSPSVCAYRSPRVCSWDFALGGFIRSR